MSFICLILYSRHSRRLLRGSAIALVLLSSWRCGSVPATYFYRVDYEIDQASFNHHDVVPATLAIAPLKSDILYESDKIVYRSSPYEVQFYHYRRWIVPPKKLVTERIFKHYRTSGSFEKVVRMPTSFRVDYILQGQIQAFEEWDEQDAWYGLVKLEFQLYDPQANEIVWEKGFSQRTVAENKKPVSVVRAISESLNLVITRSLEAVKQHVATRQQGSAN